MSTETFKCKLLEKRENSIKVEHLGRTVFLPLSQVERLQIISDRADVTIPYWLFKSKFEDNA